jgi:hypothetical protein
MCAREAISVAISFSTGRIVHERLVGTARLIVGHDRLAGIGGRICAVRGNDRENHDQSDFRGKRRGF